MQKSHGPDCPVAGARVFQRHASSRRVCTSSTSTPGTKVSNLSRFNTQFAPIVMESGWEGREVEGGVVLQTRCNDEMFIHDAARDAPNYGGRVPVDTDSQLCTCVQGPKNHTLRVRALQLRNQRTYCTPNHSAPVVAHKEHATTRTVRAQLSPPRLHSRTAGAQRGHRPPCSATVECPRPNEKFGPWNLPLRHDVEVNLLDL